MDIRKHLAGKKTADITVGELLESLRSTGARAQIVTSRHPGSGLEVAVLVMRDPELLSAVAAFLRDLAKEAGGHTTESLYIDGKEAAQA